jgi:hypothetical protein
VFGKTEAKSLWHRVIQNDLASGGYDILDSSIGASSNPTGLSRGSDTLDLFTVGSDGAIVRHIWIPSNESWTRSPIDSEGTAGANLIGGTVEAVWWSKEHMDLFALSSDSRNLMHRSWDSQQWQDWTQVGSKDGPSNLLYAPVATCWGMGRGDVFVVDKSLQVFQTTWTQDGQYPSLYQSIGGSCTSRPSVVSFAPNRIDITCRGRDARLWWAYYNGAKWSDWRKLNISAEIISEPQIISYPDAAGRLDVVVQTAENHLAVATHTQGANPDWAWTDLAGNLGSPPKAVFMDANGTKSVDVFAYSRFGSLIQLAYLRLDNNHVAPALANASSGWIDLGQSAA